MSGFVECPFDRSHLVAPKSFPRHIVKCQRQNPDVKLARCPLNTSHMVKEEDLKQHLKDCPSRIHLELYKFNVCTSTSHQDVPGTAETIIYNTDESDSKIKAASASSGNTLLNDTESWDAFTYKAYDPLENCKAKRDENGAFIIPNANKFVGQSVDAAIMKNDAQSTTGKESPVGQQQADPDGDRTPEAGYEFGNYDRNLEQFGLSRNDWHRRVSEERAMRRQDIKKESREYDPEMDPGYRSKTERNDRSSEEWKSSSRRYEAARERRSEGHPYMGRDRPRSDSRGYNDRHSDRYDRSSGGHTSRERYEYGSNPSRQSYDDNYSSNFRDRYRRESNRHNDRHSSTRYRNPNSSQDNRSLRPKDDANRENQTRTIAKREPNYERDD